MAKLSASELTISLSINDNLIKLLKLFVAAGAAPTEQQKLERLELAMQAFKTWPSDGVPDVELTEADIQKS